MDKRSLRSEMKQLRHGLDPHFRAGASERICERLAGMESVQQSDAIAGYRAFGDEADPDSLLAALMLQGRRVYFPRVSGAELELVHTKSLAMGFRRGPYNIPEPIGPSDVHPEGLAIILVPGLAFDVHGGRLGFGGGYFDRLLRRLPRETIRIGVSFAVQVIPTVPRDPWDETLDWLVTEETIWDCRMETPSLLYEGRPETFRSSEGPTIQG